MNPLVSIIIPCFQYEKYIIDCVMSCAMQTYQNIEIIVVDDCSKDSSLAVLAKICHLGNQAVIGHEVNRGYSSAKNTGIRKCNGDLIVHLDADDMLTPTSIADRVKVFEANPDLEFLHAQALKFEGDKSLSWCLRKQHKLKVDTKAQIHAQTWMMKRSVYERHGLYAEEMTSKGDKEFLSRLRLLKGQGESLVKATKLKAPVAFYRHHGASMLAMRARNKGYDKKITKLFEERMKMYHRDGITLENTPFI